MKKQIKLIHIIKAQRAIIRLFEAEDDYYPNRHKVAANERAVNHWLSKMTDDRKEQIKIWDIIESNNFNTKDWTFKPICDELRELGYEIDNRVKA